MGIPKLKKDEIVRYRYTLVAWKSKLESTEIVLETTEELAEGVWINCSDAMDKWGIGELEEMLEVFTSKVEDVERLWPSLEGEITDIFVLDAEAMEFSMVEPAKLMARIQWQGKVAKKGIKEVVDLTVKGWFQVKSP